MSKSKRKAASKSRKNSHVTWEHFPGPELIDPGTYTQKEGPPNPVLAARGYIDGGRKELEREVATALARLLGLEQLSFAAQVDLLEALVRRSPREHFTSEASPYNLFRSLAMNCRAAEQLWQEPTDPSSVRRRGVAAPVPHDLINAANHDNDDRAGGALFDEGDFIRTVAFDLEEFFSANWTGAPAVHLPAQYCVAKHPRPKK